MQTDQVIEFDLSAVEAQDEGHLVIRHPVTLQATTWIWTFYGPGHPETVALADRLSRGVLVKAAARRQAQANGRKVKEDDPGTLAELMTDKVTAVVARTKTFTPVRIDGHLIEFSREKASALLLDRRKGWLLDQVTEYLKDEVNFIQPSATS